MKKQWLDINGSIEVDVNEDGFSVEFLKWLESKGWVFAGVIMEEERIEPEVLVVNIPEPFRSIIEKQQKEIDEYKKALEIYVEKDIEE